MLAGRYRIVSMLGKGGMGEVYRADDLTLDQAVALKFLPESVADNPDAIDRFRNEVRIARQVSHANVCRVYDLGEIDGHYFLSMEYVDGEDLGSLLRRIGRLPTDKALEIARKLCAGLAAAHEKGVLHRDLKPSNVMLDSRGQVLLTDFGLAGLAGQIDGAEVRNGTPAYMAPEQLAGEEVTVRSDIYSLGLVLYEIFTGKLPFESDTLAGLIRARTTTAPESPATLVKDLDPAVERVILRCLEAKPANRPSSALAVAAALPGGDPLAAALAAGETPSPEMVAAAGAGEGLTPKFAIAIFAAALVGIGVAAWTGARLSALEMARPEFTPEVLAQKAREIVQKLGGNGHPVDSAYNVDWQDDYMNYAAAHEKPKPDWPRVAARRPKFLRFWYRQAESPLTAITFHSDLLTPADVHVDDPPFTESKMVRVDLDADGRLIYFEALPDQDLANTAKPPAPVDWTPLFAAAGLDLSQLKTAEPRWTFLAASDTRAAWTGLWPNSKYEMRVEAAALSGKPVAFTVNGPWTGLNREPGTDTSGDIASFAILATLFVVIIGGSAVLARANLRRNRGDKHGAIRIAVFIFYVQMALWLSKGHFTLSQGVFAMMILALCTSIFAAAVVWSMYIALEPYMRRRFPRTLMGWSAVLTGRINDPIVGRDVLFGVACGVWVVALQRVLSYAHPSPAGAPDELSLEPLLGLRGMLGVCMTGLPHAVRDSLLFLFLMFVLRLVLRNQWLAGVAFALIFTALAAVSKHLGPLELAVQFLALAITAAVLVRLGFLAMTAYMFANVVVGSAPVTLEPAAWYFGYPLVMLAIVIALAVWALRTATAGQRWWNASLLD